MSNICCGFILCLMLLIPFITLITGVLSLELELESSNNTLATVLLSVSACVGGAYLLITKYNPVGVLFGAFPAFISTLFILNNQSIVHITALYLTYMIIPILMILGTNIELIIYNSLKLN